LFVFNELIASSFRANRENPYRPGRWRPAARRSSAEPVDFAVLFVSGRGAAKNSKRETRRNDRFPTPVVFVVNHLTFSSVRAAAWTGEAHKSSLAVLSSEKR